MIAALLQQLADDLAAAAGLDRWRAHRRLARGRCRSCSRILRDDARPGFCSDDCHREDQLARAW